MRTELPARATVFPPPHDFVPADPAPVPVLPGHFAAHWATLSDGARLRLIESLDTNPQCPLIEADPAGDPAFRVYTFLHWGPRSTAVLLSANALVDHTRLDANEFVRLEHSSLWALSYRLPAGWEAGYRITVHVGRGPAPWRQATERRAIRLAADAGGPDPLNPHRGASMSGGAVSVVRGPAAPGHPWLAAACPRTDAPPSGLAAPSLPTPALSPRPDAPPSPAWTVPDTRAGRERTVWIYTPPSTAPVPAAGTPLLILHDGQVWARYLNLAATLDAAITAGVLPPLHVALVDSLDVPTRSAELSGPEGTVDFVAHDLLPRLRAALPVSRHAGDTIVSGASYGGLAALWQLARFPELVGCAVAQSPSLWRYDLQDELSAVADQVRIVLQAGRYEREIHDTTHALFNVLTGLDAAVSLETVPGGHDWAWWNPWLVHGLARLFDTTPTLPTTTAATATAATATAATASAATASAA